MSLKQNTASAPKAKGESPRGHVKSNSVEDAGGYGGATLATPGTPINMKGNTSPSGKVASNGVEVGPSGGVTFPGAPKPASDFNARSLPGKAKSNFSSKTSSKIMTSKETSGFSGEDTAKDLPMAKDKPYGLKSTYSKSGAHGKMRTTV